MRKPLLGALIALLTILATTVGATAPAQAHHEDKYTKSYVLRYNGALSVAQIQLNLYGYGEYTGAIDGDWGPMSRLAMAGYVDDFHTADTRPGVKRLQRIVGAKADGYYGPVTRRAVAQWQSKHGLHPDGIAGPKTRRKMGLPQCECGGH